MRLGFGRAFGWSLVAVAASAVLATPLAQRSGFEGPGPSVIAERAIGFTLMGAAMVLLVQTPVLLTLDRLLRGRVTVPRMAWAFLGVLLAMAPVIAFNMPGAAVSVKIMETLAVASSEPALFASEWLPLMVGGAVFGWHVSVSRQSGPIEGGLTSP
jgi:hypothetical protein